MPNKLTSALGLAEIGASDRDAQEASRPVQRRGTRPADGAPALARSLERSKALLCNQLFGEPSALLQLGRFALRGTLGRGGMGVVYEAWDPERRERVALKVLHGRGPSELYQLKREFRALAEITHPNLITLHELSLDAAEGEAYFTMELVTGRDFVSHVREDAALDALPRDLPQLWRALEQLCRGVHALHAAGKLHRDLKPSNVLVTTDGRVVLLDFGLAADVGTTSGDAGTPAYMAPEQAAGQPCEQSDWYSIGLILREALSGRGAHAPEDDTLATDSSAAQVLWQLAARLTRTAPTARPGFREICEIVSALEATSPSAIVPNEERAARAAAPLATSLPFVGRAAELAVLRSAFLRSQSAPVVVLVHGESGIGKSALLRAFARTTLEPANALVLRGRCYERESLPFKALDDVIDALTHHLLTLSDTQVAALCPDDTAPLVQLFPVLGRVPALRHRQLGRVIELPSMTRGLGAAALKQILIGLSKTQPLVLCIDDLQWSDTDSGRLLAGLLTADDAPHLLVIATDRTGTALPSPTVDALQRGTTLCPLPMPVTEIPLGGLTSSEALALAHAVFPDAAPAEADQLVAQARGNPMLLRELAAWASARELALPEREAPALSVLFAQRQRALTAPARQVLELVAAAGCPLPLAVLEQAAALGEPVQVVLTELRAARLVHVFQRRDEPLCELAHDSIGEAVCGQHTDDERVALHARLARAFELAHGGDSEALVGQYIGAHMPREAARCAERAAARAFSGLAFVSAARMYEIALRLGDAERPQRAVLQRGYAYALEQAGRPLEAATAYEHAAALETDRIAIAELLQRAALHRMTSGQWAEGESLLARGYKLLGMIWPRQRLVLALATALLCLPRALQLWPRRAASDRLRHARVAFLSGAGGGLEFYDPLRALHNAVLCIAEVDQLTAPAPALEARVLALRGFLRCCALRLGGPTRGIAELERASRAAQTLGDLSALADVDAQLALAYYFKGRPLGALAVAERSEANLHAELPPLTRLYPLTATACAALLDLGRLREAERRWTAFADKTRTHDDPLAAQFADAHPIRYVMLFAREERDQVAAIRARLSALCAQHPRYVGLRWTYASFRLECALYWGDTTDVVQTLRDEHAPLFASGYPPLTKLSRAIRARAYLLLAATSTDAAARAELLRAALRDAPRRRQPTALQRGRAHLVAAGVALLRGERAHALRELEAALDEFEGAQAKLAIASAEYCKGALLGGERGRTLQNDAAEVLRSEGITRPARWVRWMAAGFDEVLELS